MFQNKLEISHIEFDTFLNYGEPHSSTERAATVKPVSYIFVYFTQKYYYELQLNSTVCV